MSADQRRRRRYAAEARATAAVCLAEARRAEAEAKAWLDFARTLDAICDAVESGGPLPPLPVSNAEPPPDAAERMADEMIAALEAKPPRR
jgi:hypothetical protein